jgi:hypothetical protein
MAEFYQSDISRSDNESDGVQIKTKRGRGEGRSYDAYLSSKNSDEIINILKSEFAGARWKRGVTTGDTIWYKCKCKCNKNLSLKLLDNEGRCTVSLESDFFNQSHQVNEEVKQNGLPDDIKKMVSMYASCNEKPKSIMEKLRKEGIVVETLQISNFLAHHRKTELGNWAN